MSRPLSLETSVRSGPRHCGQSKPPPKVNAGNPKAETSKASVREKTGLSQLKFATLLGVSVRTLQEWEQGRRAPSGAARTLLLIAAKNPRALLDVA